MTEILNTLIYNPFSWLLLQLNNLTGSYGMAIILFALLTKVILLYFTAKGKKGMMRTQLIQPKLQELQKKYQNDKNKLNEAMMQLYQKEGISPTGGCFWMLLPFPILIMLYNVIREPLTRLMGFQMSSADAVSQITAFFTQKGIPVDTGTGQQAFYQELRLAQKVHENFAAVQAHFADLQLNDVNFMFLGMDLTAVPQLPWVQFSITLLIPVISAVTAYFAYLVSTRMNPTPAGAAASQTKMMALLSPALSLWIGFSMPVAMGVYWIANNVFTMAQDYFLTKHYAKLIAEEARQREELEKRRRAAEAAQKEEDRKLRQQRIEEQKKKGRKTYVMKKTPPKR